MENPKYLNSKEIAHLGSRKFDLEGQKELLRVFLEMHPECKTVLFAAGYPNYFIYKKYNVPKYTGTNLNFKEFAELYLSLDITLKNLKKYFSDKNIKNNTEYTGKLYYDFVYSYPFHVNEIISFNNYLLNEISDIKKLCREKNVEVICFIEPFHAYYISHIFKTNNFQNIKNIKENLINEFNYFIDFSIINEINKKQFNDNYFFFDTIHPNLLYGEIVYNVILKEPSKNEYYGILYEIVDKNNIEEHLSKYEKDIINYLKINEKYVTEHYSYSGELKKYNEPVIKYYKDMPKDMKKYFKVMPYDF